MLKGIRVGIACWKTHQKLKQSWFWIQFQRNTTCLSTDVLHENVRRQNTLLFEWEVTSHWTTSRHITWMAAKGIVVNPMEMKRNCVVSIFLSCLSFVSIPCKRLRFGSSDIGWLVIIPNSILEVEMVIDLLDFLLWKLESSFVDMNSSIGILERVANLISFDHWKSDSPLSTFLCHYISGWGNHSALN